MKNLILDIGNVICEWNPEKLVSDVLTDPSERREALEKVIGDRDWHALDQGLITLAEAIQRTSARSSLSAAKVEQLFLETPPSLLAFPKMVELIHVLYDRGLPMYVLSNMPEHAWRHLKQEYDFWSLFEGIVVSCEVKLLKPDPAIYAHIVETYMLDPSETLFVDDTLENVVAAREFGLHAVHLNCSNGQIGELYTMFDLPLVR